MDLKLNIYEKRKVVKTYTAETYDLMFGTVEDLLNIIDIDNIQAGDKTELIKAVAKVLKDVFEGLTDEELRKTSIKEIVDVLANIVTYSINQITNGKNGKN